jgi:hypothetical protein
MENEGGYMLGGYMLGGAKGKKAKKAKKEKKMKKEKLTLVELKDEARRLGIKGFSRMKKHELMLALKNPEAHNIIKGATKKRGKSKSHELEIFTPHKLSNLKKLELEHIAQVLEASAKQLKHHVKRGYKL